jgi:acyl carrier protein
VLVAYVVAAEGRTLHGEEVRRFLRGRLPGPMIPSAVVVLGELPITAHGKVDYDALPAPARVERELRATDEPANATEQALCRLWAEVLRVESVGVDDDFFDLGGHSLLATQLVSRIRDAFRFELPLRTLFEQPTVAQIAEVLRSEAGSPEQVDHAAGVLLRVLALSDSEVSELLAASAATDGGPGS